MMTKIHWQWAVLVPIALAIILTPLPFRKVEPSQRSFHVKASSFEYSPSVLRVNPGDTVTIYLASTDVVHGLFIDGYGLALESDPGGTEAITFVAEQPGAFRMRCSVTCGALHPFMIGKLMVGENWLLWRASALSFLAVLGVFLWRRGE
jgi:heme/copper-type cytochrome/quinol oxidase subunit 2